MWETKAAAAREPLGKVVSRKIASQQLTHKLPGAPDGTYVVLTFDTRFEHKQAAVETVTFLQEKKGEWKAAGYYIK